MNCGFREGTGFSTNAKLVAPNLEGAYLSEADLRGAKFARSTAALGNFDRAQLTHAVLVSAKARVQI